MSSWLVASAPTPESEVDRIVQELRSLPWIRPGDPSVFVGSRDPMRHRPGDKTAAEIVEEDRDWDRDSG